MEGKERKEKRGEEKEIKGEEREGKWWSNKFVHKDLLKSFTWQVYHYICQINTSFYRPDMGLGSCDVMINTKLSLLLLHEHNEMSIVSEKSH